jgi:hypothetical protein
MASFGWSPSTLGPAADHNGFSSVPRGRTGSEAVTSDASSGAKALIPPARSASDTEETLTEGEWPSPAGPSGLVKAGKTDAKSTAKIGTSSSPSASAPLWSQEGTHTGWYLCGFGHTPSRRGGYCLECNQRLWPERKV